MRVEATYEDTKRRKELILHIDERKIDMLDRLRNEDVVRETLHALLLG